MKPILTVKERNGKIAPFIGKWNVWDIPKKEWTPAVQEAILSAWRIGFTNAIDSLVIERPQTEDAIWPKVKTE